MLGKHSLYFIIVIALAFMCIISTSTGEEMAYFTSDLQFNVSNYTYEELLETKETLKEWLGTTQKEIRERENQKSHEMDEKEANIIPSEIEFRSIPWGTNISDALSYFSGFKSPEISRGWATSGNYYATEVVLRPLEKMEIAGYKLSSLEMDFYYTVDKRTILSDNDHVKLFYAEYRLDVIDQDIAYKALKEKLNVLYGAGIEDSETPMLYSVRTTWTADDGSIVRLENSSFFLKINYSVGTETSILWRSEINDEYLKREAENAEGNFDGL